jgi:DNA repair exonuclease SbcCD nuclease subunit
MSKPLFVAISDIHFNINNLDIASAALQAALDKAKYLQIPLIIAGDLIDTKAIIRGEVANRITSILGTSDERVFILIGNHDLISEKGPENSINFLGLLKNIFIISKPTTLGTIHLIPYQNSTKSFKDELYKSPMPLVVCHQGVQGAEMGDYAQDKTSIEKEALEGYKVISGHYHRHQTVGMLTYIGSPFTHTFGEANDGAKGFLVVQDDGSFTREILDFRKHVKLTIAYEDTSKLKVIPGISPEDKLWLQITGPRSKIEKINKQELGKFILGHSNYKLELIPSDSGTLDREKLQKLSPNEVLDKLIDNLSDSKTQKDYLKQLYRGICEID